MLSLGLVSLLIGLVFLPLPPPFFGMVFIAISIPLLAGGSKRVRRGIQFARWRFSKRNAVLENGLARLPGFLKAHVSRTSPEPLIRKLGKGSRQTFAATEPQTFEDSKRECR
jgi:hypothetical protein